MRERMTVVGSVAAGAWSALFLVHEGWALAVLPPLFALGCALLWSRPATGAVIVGAAQVAGLAGGVDTLSPSGLLPGVLSMVMVGARLPLRAALPVLALFLGVILATGLPLVRTVAGMLLFASTLALGRLLRARWDGVGDLRARMLAWEARDTREAAAAMVARERTRLLGETVQVIRAGVREMREEAAAALDVLNPERIAAIQARGSAAVDELRRLLGLLRAEEASTQPPQVPAAGPTPAATTGPRVAIAVGLFGIAEIALNPADHGAATYAVSLLVAATLALPGTAAALACAAATVVLAAGVAFDVPVVHGTAELATLALLSWAVHRRPNVMSLLGWAALVTTAAYAASRLTVGHAAVAVVVSGLSAAAAMGWRRLSRDSARLTHRIDELEERVASEVRRVTGEERARVAHELHDVASHALGVMLVQAGAAEVHRGADPAAAREALRTVVAAGDHASTELAALEMVTGGSAGEPATLGDRLEALAERVRRTGSTVDLGEVPDVGRVTATTIYHLVQEALTNAVKHAPGAAVKVRLSSSEPEGVEVVVTNGAASASPLGSGSGTGFGLAGMRDRVRRSGGTLTAEPHDGGFRVHALLPSTSRARVPASAEENT